MKILTIHADKLIVEPQKKAINNAEEIIKKKEEFKECLVVFTAVEKSDEVNIDVISNKLAKEIEDISKQVKCNKIIIYPYAHLSSNLASPKIALEILKLAEKELKAKKFDVTRVLFGWYKAFEIKCKGHPLSELSRVINLEEINEKDVSEAVKNEKKLKSSWFILDINGKLNEISMKNNKIQGFNFSKYMKLEKLASYEIEKVRAVKQEPPHVTLMRKMELADYEPGSDPGNQRFYPKGRLMKSLIEQYVTEKMIDYGALEVETPIMYDYEHPSVKSYINRFPARQYTIQTPNKKTFLRFAACFGQFLIAHDMVISYKDLPVKIYELAKSFRVEQRGELTGLRRLRSFTMPDCHCLCQDLSQAKEELKVRFDLAKNTLEGIGFSIPNDFEYAIRVTKDFYNQNKEFINSLVKVWNKPALIEIWEEKFFYYVFKYEINFVDALDKAATLSTDQIDVENGERYDINFVDKEGKKQHPLILHLSPSGAIERVIYALLEKNAMLQKEGRNPSFPLWMTPIQVRFIPISVDDHLKYVDNLKKKFEENKIRVDIDDTKDTLGKKIRKAELEWIPYIVVVGEKEIKENKLNVRIREENQQKTFNIDELIKLINNETKNMPFKALSLPRYLSKRPIFVG
ncbi:threonine--tRNA ligase [Candidatus Woesearchaeota archaeon]|nr:threonine--tRNA ligase [Candidatus Woesearchaeota archaeon]